MKKGRLLLALLWCVSLTPHVQSLDVVMYTTSTFLPYSPADGNKGALFCIPVDVEPVEEYASMLVEMEFDREVTFVSLQFYQSNLKREWSMEPTPLVVFTVPDGFAPALGCITGLLEYDNGAVLQSMSVRIMAQDVTFTDSAGDCSYIVLYIDGDDPTETGPTNYYLLDSDYKDRVSSNIFHNLNDFSGLRYTTDTSFLKDDSTDLEQPLSLSFPYITVYPSSLEQSTSSDSDSSLGTNVEIGVSFTVVAAIVIVLLLSLLCVIVWAVVARRDSRRLEDFVRAVPPQITNVEIYNVPPPVVILQTPGMTSNTEASVSLSQQTTDAPTPTPTPTSTRFLDPRSLASPFHAMLSMRALDLFSLAFKARYQEEASPEQQGASEQSV